MPAEMFFFIYIYIYYCQMCHCELNMLVWYGSVQMPFVFI